MATLRDCNILRLLCGVETKTETASIRWVWDGAIALRDFSESHCSRGVIHTILDDYFLVLSLVQQSMDVTSDIIAILSQKLKAID